MSRAPLLPALALPVLLAGGPALAGPDCAGKAAALARDAAELSKVELANPGDRQNTCITLEVTMDFAARVAAVAHACPGAADAAWTALWAARAPRDRAAFARHRCRRSY